jgi:demethoxyubiquinone hydroxylase (CLK1/Coq7/Cat5 family)
VDLLKQRIMQLGGRPSQGSGPWGAFAQAAEAGAAVLGEKAAVDVLEEGEDHGLKQYRNLSDLDADTRTFVEQTLLPAQLETHNKMRSLKKRLHQ